MDYYDEIADHIVANYDLKDGIIVDIGCGKGTFLGRLADRYPHVRGLGIDPSYDGPPTASGGRLRFEGERFAREHIGGDTKIAIVILRHVLEHIAQPVPFLEMISASLGYMRGVPLFIEVPDLTWIQENNAFWDFCYEHVNYFNARGLTHCVTMAGWEVGRITSAFGGQYMWAEAALSSPGGNRTQDQSFIPAVGSNCAHSAARGFQAHLRLVMDRVREVAKSRELVIWGMATKGVMYSMYLVNEGVDVRYCVDANERKQGKYAPLSGLKILSPYELGLKGEYAIICMNPNYAEEVWSDCRRLGLKGAMFTPHGDVVDLQVD